MGKILIYKSQNLEWYKNIQIDPKKIKEDEYIDYCCNFLLKLVWGFIFSIFFGCVLFIFSF